MGLQMGQQFLNQHTDQLKAKAQRKYCIFFIFFIFVQNIFQQQDFGICSQLTMLTSQASSRPLCFHFSRPNGIRNFKTTRIILSVQGTVGISSTPYLIRFLETTKMRTTCIFLQWVLSHTFFSLVTVSAFMATLVPKNSVNMQVVPLDGLSSKFWSLSWSFSYYR